MRDRIVRAHAPAHLYLLTNASSWQIHCGSLEPTGASIGNAAPVRARGQARVHEVPIYPCVVVATGNKAASGSNDVLICRSVIDADLQYAAIVGTSGILLLQVVVLSER